MNFRCPECDSIVYSRSNVVCAACGHQLPPEVSFTPAEREAAEKVLEEIRRLAADPGHPGIDLGGGIAGSDRA